MKYLFYALVIIFIIVFIRSLNSEKCCEKFATCYNMCKGKDQWECGRKCDFVQKIYGGEPMVDVHKRLGYLFV